MEQKIRPFGLRDKASYMCGDIANDFTFMMTAFFLIVFYTDVLALDPALIGILFLVARIFDAFTDIGMGRIIDNMMPKADGKFRYWIKVASPFVCILGFSLFAYWIKDLSYNFKVSYVFITYILWGSFAYTAVNIPYGSMASVISDKPEHRTSLSVWRGIGANVALFIVGLAVPLYVFQKTEDGVSQAIPERFTLVAGVLCVAAFILYRVLYKNTIERIKIKKTEKKVKTNFFKNLLTNKALLTLILAAITLVTSNIIVSLNKYLYIDYFASSGSYAIANISAPILTFIIAPFSGKLASKFGKKEITSISLIFSGLVYVALYMLKITNVNVFLLLNFIGQLGFAFFNLVIWAFIIDVIDYQEVHTNERDDATIYGAYSFARKIGQALAGSLGGFALAYVGYVSGAPEQTMETKIGIYDTITLIPAIIYFVIAFILIFLYPLSKKLVDENSQILHKRREQ